MIENVNPMGAVAILGVTFLYLGGVAAYSATLRSRREEAKKSEAS
jgi:hypothetical protein